MRSQIIVNMSKEIIAIIKELENIQELLNTNRELVRSKIEGIQPFDRRITIFTQLFGILDRAKMGFEFSYCSLDSKEIKTRMFADLTNDEFLQRINAFIHFMAIEMNQSYFSIIEAFLRQIHRSIITDPPESFWRLTKSISVTLDLPHWSQFLNFYRLVRNTLHNNGLFFPNDKKDVEVLYRGKTFSFIYGKKIHFLDADLRLTLVSDGNSFVYDVCTSQKVIVYTDIPDPSHFDYIPVPEN